MQVLLKYYYIQIMKNLHLFQIDFVRQVWLNVRITYSVCMKFIIVTVEQIVKICLTRIQSYVQVVCYFQHFIKEYAKLLDRLYDITSCEAGHA